MDNPLIKEAVETIGKLYQWHGAGGSLHIVVDDHNVDTGYIESCYHDVLEDLRGAQAQMRCYALLLMLTEDERYEVLKQVHPDYPWDEEEELLVLLR